MVSASSHVGFTAPPISAHVADVFHFPVIGVLAVSPTVTGRTASGIGLERLPRMAALVALQGVADPALHPFPGLTAGTHEGLLFVARPLVSADLAGVLILIGCAGLAPIVLAPWARPRIGYARGPCVSALLAGQATFGGRSGILYAETCMSSAFRDSSSTRCLSHRNRPPS